MSVCRACNKPLVLTIQETSNFLEENSNTGSSQAGASSSTGPQPETVPDDIQLLRCGCHFHWQCLLDAYSVTQCPYCGQSISSTGPHGQEVVLVNLHNEGGMQHDLDVLPLLLEESYLKAYPEERRSRAFLEFVREGDLDAVVDLIKASSETEGGQGEEDSDDEDDDNDNDDGDDGDDDVPQQSIDTVLRYQDPLDEGRSALHLAVAGGKIEIIWLLLLLASNLEPDAFPADVQQAAIALGLSRPNQQGLQDIRGLKDAAGSTAADTARNSTNGSVIDIRLLEVP